MENKPLEKYLSRPEASAYLKARGIDISVSTLAKYAWQGGGPQFVKFGKRKVLYTEAGLEVWIKSRTSAPLSSTTDQYLRTPKREGSRRG